MVRNLWKVVAVFCLAALLIQPAAAAGIPTLRQAGTDPGQLPEGVNPLTGLKVEDPALLALPPVMVSVSNFPVSARPQAGLSSSPYVFEVYIGMGMTRYLAMFYGSYPQVSGSTDGQAGVSAENTAIGPIRSGRVSYEKLRKLYNASLVTSGASPEVASQLNGVARVYGSDNDSINSTSVSVDKLKQIAEAYAKTHPGELNLSGNVYDPAAPANGTAAQRLWVFYNYYNQVDWQYDAASGAYLRSQDRADGSGKFYPTNDKLTGKQLAFNNVVVLFANHAAQSPTIIDVNLLYTSGKALLYRDGQAYPINWTTAIGDYEKETGRLRPIRFTDKDGNPVALKPGQTWVEVVTPYSTAQELKPGEWKVRFYAP